MKNTYKQQNLPGVPQAKQGREVAPQWAWTEASVWTERMLATLERGIKGNKWYSLIDKVWKMENLQSAVDRVVRNKSKHKPDGQRCWRYAQQKDRHLAVVQDKLRKGEYQPQRYGFRPGRGPRTRCGASSNFSTRDRYGWLMPISKDISTTFPKTNC